MDHRRPETIPKTAFEEVEVVIWQLDRA